MRSNKLILLLSILILLFTTASESFGDVSDAALLYLRIAPGARAAGMGEAYVAIADDATSTHWNPAGLASSPLAGNWNEQAVPSEFRPLSAITSVKARSGTNYDSYDIWAITPKGLVRFDNKRWYAYEIFTTKTSQTVRDIVESYVAINNPEQIEAIVQRVVADNSKKSKDEITAFTENVIAAVSEEYADREALQLGLDSLLIGYNNCQIVWSQLDEAFKLYNEGMKDSSLTEQETDKINFAVERAKSRFIAEEIKLYYNSILSNDPVSISAENKSLFVGTSNGLYMFDGNKWKTFNPEDGLPSMNILTVSTIGTSVYVGTDNGLVMYQDPGFIGLGGVNGGLPEGPITAIGGSNQFDLWVVLDNTLYHYDGDEWSNTRKYTAVLGDTKESIAKRFAIFDTEQELQYISERIAVKGSTKPAQPSEESTTEDPNTAPDETLPGEEKTADSTEEAETSDEMMSIEEAVYDESGSTEMTEVAEGAVEAGQEVIVPFAPELNWKVTTIYVDLQNRLWLGTEYGVFYFDDNEWINPGFKTVTVEEGQTLAAIADLNEAGKLSSEENVEMLKKINGLDEETLTPGQQLYVYQNRTAASINSINSRGLSVFVASTNGLYSLKEGEWSHFDQSGLKEANVIKADVQEGGVWFASANRVVAKASGRSDISMMFAKWLPELSDDIYYFFLSGATNIEGWGTFGGNITYISYGVVERRDANNNDLGSFEPFDIAFTLSYGLPLTNKLKAGLSARFIYSQLSRLGAGEEQGEGTATGLGLDLGFMYHWTDRLNLGLAITNMGPNISYIDAAQSDPLPLNLAFGFSYKLLNSEYYHLLATSEVNKSLVSMNDNFSQELKEAIFNGGFEFMYSNLVAFRAGYIYDEEGDVKTVTLGFGVAPLSQFKFDFAYIPSSTDAPLANTLRISLQILP